LRKASANAPFGGVVNSVFPLSFALSQSRRGGENPHESWRFAVCRCAPKYAARARHAGFRALVRALDSGL